MNHTGVPLHIIAALRDGGWLTTAQVADHTGYSPSYVGRLLRDLAADGAVVRGEGAVARKWHLPS